jgi:protein phosphatase
MVAERNDNKRMATTMVAASIAGNLAYIGNVGDSRGYLWRRQGLRQITKDQSLVAKLVEEGAITEAEAAIHPHRNVILYSIGSEKTPQIDLFEVPLELGDKVILCSDGLTRHVSDQEISDIVAKAELETAVATLVDLANQRGGQDNITVFIINYGSKPEAAPDESNLATTVKVPVVVTETLAKELSPNLWPYTIFLSLVEAIMIIYVWLILRV